MAQESFAPNGTTSRSPGREFKSKDLVVFYRGPAAYYFVSLARYSSETSRVRP